MSGRQTLHERTYYFEVRVNWDKLMQIDQQSETRWFALLCLRIFLDDFGCICGKTYSSK